MEIALYLLTGIVALIVLCLTGISVVVYWKDGQAMRQTIQKLTVDEFALRLCTVALILLLTAFLTLTNTMNEVVAAIFSGVAGYVLGGMRKKKEDEEKV